MKLTKNQHYLLTTLAMAFIFTLPLKAQVTIGSQDDPSNFSILELISTEGGLRLPQLSDQDILDLTNSELSTPEAKEAAKGLVVYNTTINCLEFWNGEKWISLCQSTMGTGTETDPYLVCSPEALDAMRDKPDAHYKLCQNIDLTDYLSTGAGQTKWGSNGWMPIGDATTPFTGSLDGAGYTVSGMWIQRITTGNLGLFGVVNNGTIENLGVSTSNINGSTGTYIGGLVGRISASGVISNCWVTGTGTISGSSYIGGIAGGIDGGSSVTGCYASVKMSGSNSIGGLVGLVGTGADNNGNITNCYATGSVTGGGSNIGGLVGQIYTGNITNCYATGAVSGTGPSSNDVVGGILGRITNATTSITNCVALNPSVTAAYGTDVGRVLGRTDASSATRSNNWALSNMTITVNGGTPKSPLANTGNGLDGADVSSANSTSTSWWTSASLGPGWDSAIWNFAEGELPKLK